jgi:sugar O-acyltransferase (sialic acid O-acetyltransferase NeuD family)
MKNKIVFGATYPDAVKILTKTTGNIMGFVDDVKYGNVSDYLGYPIVGDTTYLKCLLDKNNISIINNVHSSPKSRYIVAKKIADLGLKNESLIHDDVDLTMCKVGDGVFIHSSYFGANVVVGNHVSIKIGSIINHDNFIGDYAFIGPGVTLCGHVSVGSAAYIGAGAVIKEHLKIGEGAVVGAGAVVLKNVEPWTVVVGNPAKEIKKLEMLKLESLHDSI